MSKITTAKKTFVLLLAVLLVLLAIFVLPFGSSDGSSNEKPALLLQQIAAVDSLPPAIDVKIEPAVKEEVREALYLASAAKSPKEAAEKRKVEVLVKASDDAEKEIKKAGGEILNTVDSVDKTAKYFAVKADADKVAAIAADNDVSSISQRGEVYPTLDSSVPVIKADSFWNAGFKGSGVRVAVLDTGIDKNHPMLNGKVVAERDFTNSGNTDDVCGHGTHVAGIVAGSKANGGVYDGVAPDAQLLNAKVLTLNSGKCSGKVDYIIEAIGWALDPDANPATNDGAKVISMSLGGIGETSASLESELKAAVAKGATIVVSSGNCGNGCPDLLSCGSFRGVTWPGNSPSVITVGAVDDSKNVACFSSGENIAGIGVKPDFTAPGVDVTSSVPNSGYESKKGTSMAAPHVSGAVALLLGKSPGMKQGDVVRILEKTAFDIGDVGKDTSYGFGLVDMAKALAYKEGLEVKVELENQVISGSAQKITVRVYDDVTVNSVKAAITKPNNVKADVTFSSSGGNVYTYDFADTTLMGNYVVDVAVNYGGTGGSSGTGSETGGEAGSGTSGSSSITVTRTAYFKATSLTGDFGNVEEISIPQQQKLSSNLTGTIMFANTAGIELNFSALLQLLKINNGTAEAKASQEIRLQPVTVAANSKATAAVNNALEVGPGNYTARVLTDYGAGSLANETNITVADDLAPQVIKVDYSKAIKVNDAQTIIVEVNEHQKVQGGLELSQVTETAQETFIEAIIANYTVKVLSEISNRKTIAITIFNGSNLIGEEELDEGEGYVVTLQLCDESGNCYGKLGSGKKDAEFSIIACSGKRILVAKTYDSMSVFEEAAASAGGLCTSVINKSTTGTPPASYLEKFDTVVWTTGTDLANVDGSDAAVLTDYYGKKGKVAVEGSDVAFRHGSDEFMGSVLHAQLKTDLGFTVTSVANMSKLSINITRQHPVVYGLASQLPFNATIDPFPDAVKPYNGSVELAEWSGLETKGSAIVAYESDDGKQKSLLLPFSIAALNGPDAKAIATSALKWLLEDSAVDVVPLEIKYRGGSEYPLITRKIGPYCPMYCREMWQLKNGNCGFTNCGSGCGADNTTTFVREAECELAKQYYEGGAGSVVIVEGRQFTASAIIGSTEKLASPPKVKVLVDGGANGASEGEAALVPATNSDYSYNFITTLGAGQHTVTVFANSDLSISEKNYVNNIKDFTLKVYPKLPDLALSGLAYGYNDVKGAITANLSASNFGGTAATSSIKVYLNGKEAAQQSIELSAGETKQLTLEIPSEKGAYMFKAVIDPNSAVAEQDESNNQMLETLYICSKEKVLVVDDNDAEFFSTAEPSSSDEFLAVLRKDGYCAEVWDEKEKGAPGSSDLSGYKAVVWSAGDYFGGTISNEDAMAIGNYSGSLLVEGSDVGLDNADSGFLQEIAAAAFSNDMLLNDSENESLVLKQHAITAGITGISVSKEKSPYPDAIDTVGGEMVAEWQNGKAAITANAGIGRKTAYYAFSVDGITEAEAMEKLITNTVGWLLEKQNNQPRIQNFTDGNNVSYEEIGVAAIKVTMKEGETKNFSVLALDPDGDPLTYKWLLNGTPVSATYYFAFSPKYNESGSYNLTIIVSDGQAEARAELLITVLDTMECEPAKQTKLCQLQFGVCRDSNVTCGTAGKWPGCTAATYLSYSSKYEVAETSCDGLDNDCDGLADEGFGDVDDDKIADCVDDDNDNDGTKDDEDDLIGDENSVNFTGDAKDIKIRVDESEDENEKAHKVKWVRLNNSDKPLLQFKYNFSKGNIALRNLTIEKQKNNSKEGFTLVKGLDLKGKRKQVFVDRLVNGSNAVCIKDKEVSAVAEVTGSCSSGDETLLECDFPKTGPPYGRNGWTCASPNNQPPPPPEECEPLFCQYIKETGQFQVYGLKHSAVMEACTDADLDSYLPTGCSGSTALDCNDGNSSINPSAVETCNSVDDNCNGQIDENRACNTAPVLQGISNRTVSENGVLSFTVAAIDNEGDILTYNATHLPQEATFDNATAAFAWTPSFDQAGVYVVTFNVSDGLLSDYETVNITVANTNRAPVFEKIGNRTVPENATLDFFVSVTDPDGNSLAQLFVNVPEKLGSAAFDTETRQFRWAPTFDDSGTYAIWFTASDGQLSTNEFVNITVVNINRPPKFENLTNQTVFENSTLQFFVNMTDLDGQAVEVVAVEKPAASTFTDNIFSWVLTFEDSGNYRALFEASDAESTVSASVNITVTNVNRMPIISGASGNLTVNETETATVAINASDPDGDALSYAINDTRFAQAVPGRFEWSTGFTDSGTYPLLATVSDGFAAVQVTTTVKVNNVNRAPRFENVTNQTVLENSTLKFFANATEPDGDSLQFTAEVPPQMAEAEFNSNEMEFSWKPTFEDAGSYKAKFIASDGQYSAEAEANITVLNVNRAPAIMLVLVDPPELAMGEGETKTFSADVSDPDSDGITFEWEVNGETVSTEATMEFTAAYDSSGEYIIELSVSDYEATATTAMTLTVHDTLDCGAGQTRLCSVQQGICANSFETCTASGHWQGCSASDYGSSYTVEEKFCSNAPNVNSCYAFCDTLDNDCDGSVDEERVCNRAPVMQHIGNMTVNENETLEFALKATDGGNDPLTFSAGTLPTGKTPNPPLTQDGSNAAKFSWPPTFEQSGTYEVTFEANDGLLYDQETINISVVNVNRAPEVNITLEPPGAYASEGNFKLLRANASDPDEDELNYKWFRENKPVSTIDSYYFFLNMTDGGQTHTFTVEVSDGNITTNTTVQIVVWNTQLCKPKDTEAAPCGSSAGMCRQGTMTRTCSNDYLWGEWGECTGGIKPAPEDCGTWEDDDCDAAVNEGCSYDLATGWMNWKVYETYPVYKEVSMLSILNASLSTRIMYYGGVVNKGKDDAPPTMLVWYLNDRFIMRANLPRINAGKQFNISAITPYPPYIGNNFIKAVVNADGKLSEADKTNNEAGFNIPVKYNETYKEWAKVYEGYYKRYPTREECENQGKCWS